MKTLLIALCCLVAVSCSDNDDKATDPVARESAEPNDSIEGDWSLVEVKGGITGTIYNYPEGMITWKFNGISQTVAVTNNNTDPMMQDILPTGQYNYTFVSNEATPELCATNIKVDGVNLGCFDIGSSEFTMSQIEADGFMITLIR